MNELRLTDYEINILQDALTVLADSNTVWGLDEYEWAQQLQTLSLKLEEMKSNE